MGDNQVQNTLYIEIVGSLSEKGFSLDELVIKTKELFEKEGMAGFVGLLLSLFDEHISLSMVRGVSGCGIERCCSNSRYEFYRRSRKRFRTSIGTVRIQWRRLRCINCKNTIVPLRHFLGLKQYQSRSSELERMLVEVVSEQSYRRTSKHLKIIGEIPVPKSTAHRWVMESDCDEIRTDGKLVDVLVADGTGYKRRSDPSKGISNRGDLKVVLGITTEGTVVPFGSWSSNSWEEIGEQIRKKTVKADPIAKILLSDGELGLSEGLAHLANEEQRCHWHEIHDLDHFMWQDNATKSERIETQKRLAGTIGIEIPEEDFESVPEQDKVKIEESTREAEQRLDELIKELYMKGYRKAARYVSNAKDRLFTYIRFWLKYGLVSPRSSSMIERMMREIGRRLKRMAFGWSEKGAAKMARIIIKRITTAGEWEKYWEKRLRITGNVLLVYRGVQAK